MNTDTRLQPGTKVRVNEKGALATHFTWINGDIVLVSMYSVDYSRSEGLDVYQLSSQKDDTIKLLTLAEFGIIT